MNPYLDALRDQTRRHFLGRGSLGLGALAVSSWLGVGQPVEGRAANDRSDASDPMALRAPHRAAKAKSVIYLHMAGSPPHLDLFDYKPELNARHMQDCPEELRAGERFAFIKGVPKLLGTPHRFARRGRAGTWVSDLLPRMAESGCLDHLTIVRSMTTDQFNHAPAQLFLYTGAPRLGRPSMGSWVTYGLGSEAHDLPGFVVLLSGGSFPSAGKSVWGSGFLPSVYQGVQCRSVGDPVLYLSNPRGMDRAMRRRSLDAINALNQRTHEATGDQEVQTRIAQYEMAYKMQMSVPEVMEIADEPEAIHDLYGTAPGRASFANNCLLARRLVERGVRFVQLFDWGWDMHGTNRNNDLLVGLPRKCRDIDRPIAALLTDLHRRGLLEETLVVWGGEFGRTPMNEARNGSTYLGRDHHPHAFTLWLAGGGIKAGHDHGATDPFGYRVDEDPVGIHDLQATILHLLGIDHEALTYTFQGRPFRLTDVAGTVVEPWLA